MLKYYKLTITSQPLFEDKFEDKFSKFLSVVVHWAKVDHGQNDDTHNAPTLNLEYVYIIYNDVIRSYLSETTYQSLPLAIFT